MTTTAKFPKLMAAAAVCGALTLGGAVLATAAGAATGGSSSGTDAPNCAKAPAVLARIDKLETRASNWLPGAEQREATAQQDGDRVQAARIARRIARVERLQQRGDKLEQKIEAACPGAAASS